MWWPFVQVARDTPCLAGGGRLVVRIPEEGRPRAGLCFRTRGTYLAGSLPPAPVAVGVLGGAPVRRW